jgi:hypothetical protein
MANDPQGTTDAMFESRSRLLLNLTLASAAGLLGLIGWVLTL